MIVLFIDLLGSKSRWHQGGREAAERGFQRFATVMARAISKCDAADIRDGVVETDAAAIVFGSVDQAVRCAREAYVMAFNSARTRTDERLWLRGAIMPADEGSARRSENPISVATPQVRLSTLDRSLLDAIAVEKGGFKGMRLLLSDASVDQGLGRRLRIRVGKRSFIPFRRLNNSVYPGRLERGFQDFFWMATENDEEWERRKRTMASRLRWSSRDPDEFLQAAATQVVFHECSAIIGSLRHGQ